VAGDLSSIFNFRDPDDPRVKLPPTDRFLPPVNELAGGNVTTFIPAPNQVIVGVPKQEKGVRPARALPYELHTHGRVDASSKTFGLEFVNTGKAGAAFEVRSGNTADNVRMYTVESGKRLSGTWNIVGSNYDLSVYGPNGFARYFKGTIGSGAASLDVHSIYGRDDEGSIALTVTNTGTGRATVVLLNAYTGEQHMRALRPGETFLDRSRLDRFHGWYDLIVRVIEDPTFESRLAGHVETGRDSFSDPALGGLVTLQT
jgi:phospholipase C